MEQIPITKTDVEVANKEGAYLYSYLRKKYPNESTAHMDVILNSLSFALLTLMHRHVRKQDREMMVQIVTIILETGIRDSNGE